jgi:methionine aminopeptidase
MMSITGEQDIEGLKRAGAAVAAARDAMGARVEPFLTTGATLAVEDIDGWTLRSPDGSRGAQFEHTLIITRGRPIVVT